MFEKYLSPPVNLRLLFILKCSTNCDINQNKSKLSFWHVGCGYKRDILI